MFLLKSNKYSYYWMSGWCFSKCDYTKILNWIKKTCIFFYRIKEKNLLVSQINIYQLYSINNNFIILLLKIIKNLLKKNVNKCLKKYINLYHTNTLHFKWWSASENKIIKLLGTWMELVLCGWNIPVHFCISRWWWRRRRRYMHNTCVFLYV